MNTSRQEDGETVSNRQVGYGLVFGVPKSLSIYLAITNDQVVENIARSAVDKTMGAMEFDMQCKVRKGRLYEDRRTGELLYSISPTDASVKDLRNAGFQARTFQGFELRPERADLLVIDEASMGRVRWLDDAGQRRRSDSSYGRIQGGEKRV
jgi:hypothetical protein